MNDTIAEMPTVSVDEVSIARLHGFACWDCGAVARELTPCGTVPVTENERVLTISRCAACRQPMAS